MAILWSSGEAAFKRSLSGLATWMPLSLWLGATSPQAASASGRRRIDPHAFMSLSPSSRPPPDRLLPPPLHRRAETDRLAIFGDRATGDVEAFGLEQVDELIVRQDLHRILGRDQGADPALHRLGRGRFAAVIALDAAGEEI